ncbi:Sua5/YciO/YrdC/YwlC family protein, partial [Borreliella garinii]
MISTEIIRSNQIQKAAKLIKMGELVVFPTETVYGIGANAYNEDAVKMIFLVKKRPI